MQRRDVLKGVYAAILAAGAGRVSSAKADLAEARSRGKVIVSTTGNLPPCTFINDQNVLDGYDIAVAHAVEKSIGIPFDFQIVAAGGMLPGLQTGRFDVVVSNINALPERGSVFDWSVAYSRSAVVAVARAAATDIGGFKDLKGKVVGAINGAADGEQAARSIAEKYGAFKELRVYSGFNELFQDMAIGRIEAAVTPENAAAYFNKRRPGIVRLTQPPFIVRPVAAHFHKGEPQLRAAFDEPILALRKSGKLDEWAEQYFGIKDYVSGIPETPPNAG
jgi:cystine transport system substrate-binding protein